MARPGGNPLCVGKKGRSGRKSCRDEKIRNLVIQKAWEKKNKRMTDNDATQIVVKDMGVRIKGDPDNPLVFQNITGMKILPDGTDFQNENSKTD